MGSDVKPHTKCFIGAYASTAVAHSGTVATDGEKTAGDMPRYDGCNYGTKCFVCSVRSHVRRFTLEGSLRRLKLLYACSCFILFPAPFPQLRLHTTLVSSCNVAMLTSVTVLPMIL